MFASEGVAEHTSSEQTLLAAQRAVLQFVMEFCNKFDTFQQEKQALLTAFELITQSDVVYVFAPNGYVGKTVAMEIAFAYANGIPVMSSERIEEFSAQALVQEILEPDHLLQRLAEK